jgi:hypothetical protein
MMPLEGLFATAGGVSTSPTDHQRALCEFAGVLVNPFPSAGQTSAHPHLATDADTQVDDEVITFYNTRNSQVLAITATQGIGKTNLLNAYEQALSSKLADRGFFVIRYVADPDRYFDRLLISLMEHLGEEHLKNTVTKARNLPQQSLDAAMARVRTHDFREMLERLIQGDIAEEVEPYGLAYQWFLGLPARKLHREVLGVNYRLDTVETKTRALRDLVCFSAEVGTIEGIFLLLDELEKGDISSSKTELLRYLQAMRALIDALPKYLFLMLALTPDALDRYREMQPALKGRLAKEVRLYALRTEEEALALYRFYLNDATAKAETAAKAHGWKVGKNPILTEDSASQAFGDLKRRSTTEGVRQRDFLYALHERASVKIKIITS